MSTEEDKSAAGGACCLSVNGTKGVGDIVDEVMDEMPITKELGQKIVYDLLDVMAGHLAAGSAVRIPGIATFTPVLVKEKKGRDLNTGVEVLVKPQVKVKTVFSRGLSHKVQQTFASLE